MTPEQALSNFKQMLDNRATLLVPRKTDGAIVTRRGVSFDTHIPPNDPNNRIFGKGGPPVPPPTPTCSTGSLEFTDIAVDETTLELSATIDAVGFPSGTYRITWILSGSAIDPIIVDGGTFSGTGGTLNLLIEDPNPLHVYSEANLRVVVASTAGFSGCRLEITQSFYFGCPDFDSAFIATITGCEAKAGYSGTPAGAHVLAYTPGVGVGHYHEFESGSGSGRFYWLDAECSEIGIGSFYLTINNNLYGNFAGNADAYGRGFAIAESTHHTSGWAFCSPA